MTNNLRRIVLITGGSGFLGRHCLPLLADAFDEVHATSTRVAPLEQVGVQWHQIDLLHNPSIVELVARVRPTHLLHLAWVTEHGSFWNSLENARWLEASVRLVQAFTAWGGRRVVTAGSCAEYDWQSGRCDESRTLCAPATLYGACKHALRLTVESTSGISSAHTRIFHLFGPHEDARRLTPSIVNPLLAGDRAACTHGEQLRDFMYVKDVAAAHVELLAGDVQGPVNVASGQAVTIREFVASIGRLLGCEEKIDFNSISSRRNDPPVLTADITRLKQEVAFTPSYSQQAGLEEILHCRQRPQHTPTVVRQLAHSAPATNVACSLCNSSNTVEFLRRSDVPVHQNLVLRDVASARVIARGTLAMRACSACGFVFNAAFDPSLLSYGEQYDNTQTHSLAFSDYVNELVQYLIHQRGVRGKRIVEVGCGKGDFLRRLVGDAETDNSGWGFDPTYFGPDEELNGRLRFQRTFYDAACAKLPADVIVCRHVIEHVPNPRALLGNIRRAEGAQVYVETPCIRWILRNEVVWDLFYEHCSLFTVESLTRALEQSGFHVDHARHVFGGQYLWFEAEGVGSRFRGRDSRPNQDPSAKPSPVPVVSQAIAYGDAERRLVRQWQDTVEQHSNRGGVCVWGAGAKGVTFANLVDPSGGLIDCVVDLNPAKQGGFLAGTGHAIIAADQLLARKVAHALVLNPNYVSEIQKSLASVAPHIAVVDLSKSTISGKRAA